MQWTDEKKRLLETILLSLKNQGGEDIFRRAFGGELDRMFEVVVLELADGSIQTGSIDNELWLFLNRVVEEKSLIGTPSIEPMPQPMPGLYDYYSFLTQWRMKVRQDQRFYGQILEDLLAAKTNEARRILIQDLAKNL